MLNLQSDIAFSEYSEIFNQGDGWKDSHQLSLSSITMTT